jgi:glycerophosphoryl diester phosphodiesterase
VHGHGVVSIDTLLVIAHKACPTHAPENTLAGVRAAKERGADAVEVDVRLTSDGVPVVLHDWHVLRVGRRARLTKRMRADELQRLHVLGSDQTIPTLRQVLAEAGPMGVAVDVKEPRAAVPVLDVLEDGHDGRVMLWSESDEVVRRLGRHAPSEYEVALMRGGRQPKQVTALLDDARAWGARAVSADERVVDRALVERAAGLGLGVYTLVNARSSAAIAAKAAVGVRGVVTDWPELAPTSR